jgi:hypothetical protein
VVVSVGELALPQPVDQLVHVMQAFLDGATSLEHVSALEGAFAACDLDDDEAYADLGHALAMYRGAGYDDDVTALRHECAWAIRQLTGTSAT